jgi:hypothetical protein
MCATRHMSAFPRKRLVKRRARETTIEVGALSAACAYVQLKREVMLCRRRHRAGSGVTNVDRYGEATGSPSKSGPMARRGSVLAPLWGLLAA